MKKKLLLIGIFFALLCGCLAAGCASSRSYDGKLKVTYELEGGVYRNGTSVVQYYAYSEGGSNRIRAIGADSGTMPERAGYRLEGWYRVRSESAEGVVYSEKWNFETDRLSGESVVLYARWVRESNHVFEIHYYEGEEDLVKGSVDVEEGASFESILPFAKSAAARSGYTVLGWTNADGTPFDMQTKHPGGEEDVAVPVYVAYIEGVYEIVSTAEELKKYATTRNVYLTADIDLGGAEFSFGDYRMRKFKGNGHTISNFQLKYSFNKNALVEDFEDDSKKCVSASLFGSAYKSEISDVNFSFTAEIETTYSGISGNIYLAALAVAPENATFRNVDVSATYTIVKLPSGRTEEMVIVSDKGYYKADANSSFEDVKISFTKKASE